MNKTKAILMILAVCSVNSFADLSYPIVDTGQIRCYSNTLEIEYPQDGKPFFGQDAHYNGNQPAYKDNGDGTISDLNTGLMWTQNPFGKVTYAKAVAGASKCSVGGYTDWRLPTIKELYSLILFSGTDPDPMSTNTSQLKPFIDQRYFKFQYGNTQAGERIIDSQFATSTIYKSTTMSGNKTMFGVNFADGRIKGYPMKSPRGEKTFYVLYVRENPGYGKNQFVDNGDGTITDKATGLTWMKADSGKPMNWGQALKYAENLDYAGHSDWRLPNAKELHSIVDYTRCPDVTDSAAIDPIFDVTPIKNEGGQKDYAHYWTGTSHISARGSSGVYIAFGRGLGFMENHRTGQKTLMDVHGAGCQRSDPKTGNASKFPYGRGPQGDVIRIGNFVRSVRGGLAEPRTSGPKPVLTQSSRPQRQGGRPQSGQPGTQQGRRSGRGQSGRGSSGGDFVERLDKDGDGKVSRQEFDGPAQHFSHLDRNNDGYLSESEAPSGPPPRR
ncbi:MAG: Lcl C-terminal domain-containing protein [Planctomycetota bacterium]